MCQLKDYYEPGRGLEYAYDLNEMLAVKYENEYRAYKASEKK